MANQIASTTYDTRGFVSATSRYADGEIIYYGDLKLLTFKTYKKNAYMPDPKDMYSVVSSGWEYRPDKASSDVYGTPDFWWKIMEANDIKDVFDFKSGLNIRIPVNPY